MTSSWSWKQTSWTLYSGRCSSLARTTSWPTSFAKEFSSPQIRSNRKINLASSSTSTPKICLSPFSTTLRFSLTEFWESTNFYSTTAWPLSEESWWALAKCLIWPNYGLNSSLRCVETAFTIPSSKKWCATFFHSSPKCHAQWQTPWLAPPQRPPFLPLRSSAQKSELRFIWSLTKNDQWDKPLEINLSSRARRKRPVIRLRPLTDTLSGGLNNNSLREPNLRKVPWMWSQVDRWPRQAKQVRRRRPMWLHRREIRSPKTNWCQFSRIHKRKLTRQLLTKRGAPWALTNRTREFRSQWPKRTSLLPRKAMLKLSG